MVRIFLNFIHSYNVFYIEALPIKLENILLPKARYWYLNQISSLIFQTIAKRLCFLFTLASMLHGNSCNVTFSKFLRDCKDWNQPFIETNHFTNAQTFQAKKWSIKLFDEKFTYLNSTVRIDIRDLTSGDFLENAIFKYMNYNRRRVFGTNWRTFTAEEKTVSSKISKIVGKYNDFCSTLKPMSDRNPAQSHFPSQMKVCTSACDQDPDICLELKKMD